jgi:beta-glucanase (GH16 family)
MNAMKNIKIILTVCLIALFSCEVDDGEFGPVVAPSNLQLTVAIAGDQSGNVTVTPTSEGTLNYHIFFTEEAEPVIISQGETASFRYTQSGQYSQVISVIAYGTGGASSSLSQTIDLDVRLIIDEATLQLIAGNANMPKRWVWDSENAGHFGVGDPAENFPNFFSAAPNSLNECLYDDVLIFDHDGNNTYSFQLETANETFTNWAEVKRFFPDATPQQFVDECRDIRSQIQTDTDFVIIEDTDGTLNLSVTGSTMSYWSGATQYVITELTPSKMTVRGIQSPFDPPGNDLAWYHSFVPEGGTAPPPACASGATGATGSGNNDVLVWADEFNTDGSPCDGNWDFDFGTGEGGWGNNESQFYRDSTDNIVVENGMMKITAKAENFSGSDYTSARIKTQDKFEFTYGKIVTRAKLPTGGGTWPAIWTLGADFETNPWPAAGEMDIMEHVGNMQNEIFSTIHYPGNSGANGVGNSTIVPGVSDDFHIYELDWTPTELRFSIDGTVHFTVANNPSLPFDKDFFLIMNVAMGGNFGGTINPSFIESTMEVDYIRVYQ